MKIKTNNDYDSTAMLEQPELDNLSQKITQLLNAVFYASNDAMLLLDQEGTILILNPNTETVFRCKDSSMRGRSFENFIPLQNRQKFINLLRHFALTSAEGSTPIEKMEIAALRTDGTAFPMEISLSVINIDNEIFFIATVSDIAARKRTEVEISMLAHALKSITESLVIIDLEGKIIFANESLFNLFEYRKGELKGEKISQLCPESSKDRFTNEIIPNSLSQRWEGEIEGLKKSGQNFPFHLTTSPVKDESGNVILIICVGRDITERKRLEEQLRHAQKMEAIGQLAGGVAHDFNNLLIVISGYSNNLLESIGTESEYYKNVQQISKAAERAASLTRQLLAFSRKQILQPKLIDLNALIHDMEKMLKRLIGENITFTANLDSGIGNILADPGQTEQVIMNLVVNARDAMPDGGQLQISTGQLTLSERDSSKYKNAPAGDYIYLKIKDTGIGMPDEVRERIFEPFYTTKEQGKGTGLGLSTVYGIIEQSGCYIMVESKKNKGTCFNILIPKVTIDIEKSDQEEQQKIIKNIHGSETILVVEDEEQVRELVTEMLETYGYKILEAFNGREAIDIYNKNRNQISLILTDVVMPEMGGKKLIQSLDNFKPGTRVLYMSGYTDNAIDEQGILDPGTQFIQKPFSPADLLLKVRKVLDS